MLYIPEYPFSSTTLCLLYLRVAFLCFTGFILFPCLSNDISTYSMITVWQNYIKSVIVSYWINPSSLITCVSTFLIMSCVSNITSNNKKWLFKNHIPIPYIFFNLSTFPFHSLFCITHHALNQILKKSHIFHKLHCLFHGLQKDTQRTVSSALLQKPCPFIRGTAMARAASLPHLAGVLRVPEISSAIPLLASAHFSTRTGTTSYTVGNQ